MSITVKVKLFAAFQDAYHVPELRLEFPDQTSVSAILDYCIQEHPELEKWRTLTQFGINLEFVSPETLLNHGDEVVLIPPVSGGSF
ncbi:MAG: MoaD/ThiS family protein [Planktothrix sp.]|uniref:MoaD/ThiS family protein n=1 Tax=Planktothrix sp. TaxID=3088171 RepID=UPI0038D49903